MGVTSGEKVYKFGFVQNESRYININELARLQQNIQIIITKKVRSYTTLLTLDPIQLYTPMLDQTPWLFRISDHPLGVCNEQIGRIPSDVLPRLRLHGVDESLQSIFSSFNFALIQVSLGGV